MGKDLDEELGTFFSQDTLSVVADSDKFRMKLGIGSEAFKYLSRADNLSDFVTSIIGGSAAAGTAFSGWIASLGVWGQLGLAVGFISTPTGWLTALFIGGATSFFLVRKLFKKIKKTAVTEVPNFINTPLDVLAASICDLFTPILLKIARADGDYCDYEKEKIKRYYVDEWGISEAYAEGLIRYDESNLDNFSWRGLEKTIRKLEKTGDVRHQDIAREIVKVVQEIITADGNEHKKEEEEFDKLKESIGIGHLQDNKKKEAGWAMRILYKIPFIGSLLRRFAS